MTIPFFDTEVYAQSECDVNSHLIFMVYSPIQDRYAIYQVDSVDAFCRECIKLVEDYDPSGSEFNLLMESTISINRAFNYKSGEFSDTYPCGVLANFAGLIENRSLFFPEV